MSSDFENWRLYEPYRKLLFNLYFTEDPDLIRAKENKFHNFNEKIRNKRVINLKTYELPWKTEEVESDLNSIVIDFEGNDPVKLLGLYFNGCIYSYLLNMSDPTSRDIEKFYQGIIGILPLLQGLLVFGFTFWDYEVIRSIGLTIKDQSQPLENLLYFNLQSRDRESISEALYSIGEEIPRDPLYRSNRKINQLHGDGFFDIIREHNRACIKAELKILWKRFL